MLERIEKAFSSQERFVADASHQLLTPLTILKGEIETNTRATTDQDQLKIYKSLLQEVDNLSKIVKEFQRYHKSDEINITMDERAREAAIERLKETYKNADQDELDGLTVSFADWWFNVRKSNTEPLLRLTIETPDKEMTDAKKEEILKIIQK